jgi:hypothetical protein
MTSEPHHRAYRPSRMVLVPPWLEIKSRHKGNVGPHRDTIMEGDPAFAAEREERIIAHQARVAEGMARLAAALVRVHSCPLCGMTTTVGIQTARRKGWRCQRDGPWVCQECRGNEARSGNSLGAVRPLRNGFR